VTIPVLSVLRKFNGNREVSVGLIHAFHNLQNKAGVASESSVNSTFLKLQVS